MDADEAGPLVMAYDRSHRMNCQEKGECPKKKMDIRTRKKLLKSKGIWFWATIKSNTFRGEKEGQRANLRGVYTFHEEKMWGQRQEGPGNRENYLIEIT